jgi:hypothetical protein
MNYLNRIINEVLPKSGKTLENSKYEKLEQASLPILWRKKEEYERILVCTGKFYSRKWWKGKYKDCNVAMYNVRKWTCAMVACANGWRCGKVIFLERRISWICNIQNFSCGWCERNMKFRICVDLGR